MPTFHVWHFHVQYIRNICLCSVYTNAWLAAVGNRPCWKDSFQLIMTGQDKSPTTFAAWQASVTWPVSCDRWLTWPETDICITLQLRQPCLFPVRRPSEPAAPPLIPSPWRPCTVATISSICQPHGEVSLSTCSASSSPVPRLLSVSSSHLFCLCEESLPFSFHHYFPIFSSPLE